MELKIETGNISHSEAITRFQIELLLVLVDSECLCPPRISWSWHL
mgnify:CR=1 FL=1